MGMSHADELRNAHGKKLAKLALGAIGVVFGDIGTSPLYTMKETLGTHGMTPQPLAVLGVLSLIFWSLLMVISLKYVTFVMRADNKGEGGIMALMALAQRSVAGSPRTRWVLAAIGIFGASLFYGDGVITRPCRCFRRWKASKWPRRRSIPMCCPSAW